MGISRFARVAIAPVLILGSSLNALCGAAPFAVEPRVAEPAGVPALPPPLSAAAPLASIPVLAAPAPPLRVASWAGLAPALDVDPRGRRVDLVDDVRAMLSGLGPLDAAQAALLDDAVEVAFLAHGDDRRRFGDDVPYLRHVVGAVRTLIEEFGVRDPKAVAVMLLHDVQEDHPDVWRDQKSRFDADVRGGVDRLTKKGDFETYIGILARDGTRHDLLGKLADRVDNLRSIRLSAEENSPVDSRAELMAFARKKFTETAAHVVPMVERAPQLTDSDRRTFFRATLAEVRLLQAAEPAADFLEPLARRLSALIGR